MNKIEFFNGSVIESVETKEYEKILKKLEGLDYLTVIKNDKVFFIPEDKNKPIKITYEELPCPLLLNIGEIFRCKHAKFKSKGVNFEIYCSSDECEILKAIKIKESNKI